MIKKYLYLWMICFSLLTVVALTGCGTSTADEETVQQTQAAQLTSEAYTVMETAKADIEAQMLMTAEAAATDTPFPTIEIPTIAPLPPTQSLVQVSPAVSLPPPDAVQTPPQGAASPPTASAADPTEDSDQPSDAPPGGGDKADLGGETIPDGTFKSPGQTFTKTWTIQNTGTTTWLSDYQVVFDSGARMSGEATNVPYSVTPGMAVDISIVLVAPESEGKHRGYWILQNSNGERFGVGETSTPFWLEIEVSNWLE